MMENQEGLLLISGLADLILQFRMGTQQGAFLAAIRHFLTIVVLIMKTHPGHGKIQLVLVAPFRD